MDRYFEFATATRIVFGAGSVAQVPALVREFPGTRALLVTGKSPARAAGLRAALDAAGVAVTVFPIAGEPTVDDARAGVAVGVRERCDLVIGFGGGSAVDGGKAIAGLLGNGGDPLDYIELVGRGAAIGRPSLPFIAIPTTAGTGSEVTRNAVLGSKDARVKASLRSPYLLPKVAVVDPDLLAGVPVAVLAASGLDALSQLIEPFLCAQTNPLCDALAREGMVRSARSLRRAYLEGADGAAREDLALASLFGGLCLANAGLGAVHGFAAPIGGMYDAPHGAVCAALLPAAMEVNARALAARAPDHPSLGRMREIAVLLTGDGAVTASDGLAWLRRLCTDLRIPGLGHYGLSPADVPLLVARAKSASSMKKNPIVLTDEELTQIALASL